MFADLGYVRASIEAIAAQADVSTRTIYNHFQNKDALFQTTIEQSASRVAAAQIEIVGTYLTVSDDSEQKIEARLIEFATAWIRPLPDYAEHRALVDRVRAEVGRIPRPALDAWQAAGPLQVRRALARAFAALAAHGDLRIDDPDVAATHFTRLVTVDDPLRPGRRTTKKQVSTIIANGVRAFLYGYGTDRTGSAS
ncbi:TetR/AcrR family transcriptional regulator C-terminal domain-containing protein [Solicola gregarius]|uniref:TetR/AcrR family transcriptional regulator C-terminal domain-containing protein n=1 Tax=Solicola gregarius TaxID=2908642 RepID=A0AA46TLD3_9ACTN|nr:TetR/AcrR family transcriptional regulator C-terminal domain-containing protein [Solicola gregarius]